VNIRKANLEDLVSFYFGGERVTSAMNHIADLILAKGNEDLASLLRNHRFRSIKTDKERYLRAGMDDFLLGCDVLEIAILTGFIDPPEPTVFWQRFGVILGNKEARLYFEQYYPVKLPQLLALRLQGRFIQTEQEDSMLTSFMLQFLALDRGFMESLNGRYLLKLLDSFRIDGYRFNDIAALISHPKTFVERILLPPKKRTVPDIALQELVLFFQFAESLQKLLNGAADRPLVQAEAWSHYSYWFEKLGVKLNQQLGSALDRFLTWQPVGDELQGKVEIQIYVNQAKLVLHQLTIVPYSHLVDAVLQQHRLKRTATKVPAAKKQEALVKPIVKTAARKAAKKAQVKLRLRH
jgi:hypothetical protein